MAEDLTDTINQLPDIQDDNSLRVKDNESTGYLTGFLTSAVSSVGEQFGGKPMAGAEEFRQNNPVMGFGSQLLGIGGEYAAYTKAVNEFEGMQKLIQAAGQVSDIKPISGAVQNVVKYAPIEAAQVGATAVNNPDQLKSSAGAGAINLGVEALAGGIGALTEAGGRTLSAADKAKADIINLRDTPQEQISTLKQKVAENAFSPDILPTVNGKIKDLEAAVRLETVGVKDAQTGETSIVRKALGDLVSGEPRDINRLFNEGDSEEGAIKRSRLIFTPGSKSGFQSRSEMQRVIDSAGLNGQWENVSLPRYVGFGEDAKQAAGKVEADLIDRGQFTQVDDNLLMNREKDGLYVMAKKITGQIGESSPKDEWVIWKTSHPGNFTPKVQGFVDKQIAKMAFQREPLESPTGNPLLGILDSSALKIQQTPMTNYLAGVEKGYFGKGMNAARKVFGLPEVQPGSSFLTERVGAFVDDYLTPNLYQWTQSPRAKWIFGHARDINDSYRKVADKILFGEYKPVQGSVVRRALSDPGTTGKVGELSALQPLVKDMTTQDIASAIHASEYLADVSESMDDVHGHIDNLLAQGEINKKVSEFLHTAHAHDTQIMQTIGALQEQVGLKPFEPLAGHVMLSRTWEGNYRSFIENEAGDKIYVTGGKTPKVADERAKAIMKEAQAKGMSGLTLRPAEAVDAAQDIRLGESIKFKSQQFRTLSGISRQLAREPSKDITMLKERTGMQGFQTNFTQSEFMDKLKSHVNERFKYMSKTTRQFLLGAEIQRLLEYDPKTAKSLINRFTDLDGEAGLLGKMQNQAVDKIMGPAMGGRNSASKIVDTLNEYQYHMNFGAFNLAFPAINALTFVQTVAPEVAMVMNIGNDIKLNKYYGSMVALGSDKRPRGLLGFLDPAKITLQGMREMAKPGKLTSDLLDRALSDGVIDPKLTAEFMGDTAKFKTTLKEAFQGKDSWSNAIKTVSTYLPEKSERLGRAHAFITGRLVAEDLLGFKDPDQIYRFAKQFTQRTMYGYQTVDRPQIFTSPLGRTFGLFKNWQAHYMATMAQYAGEFNQGNFAPLLWQMGGTGAVGGLVGLPVYGVADSFSKWATNKTLMTNYYNAFGNSDPNSPMGNVHDAVFWGLPSFLGLTFSGNVSAPGADPARDAAGLLSFPQWQRASDLASAVGDAFDTWSLTGKHPGTSPDVMQKFALAILPKTFQRYISDTTNQIISLRSGKVQADGLSDYELIMHQLGFTPKRLGINQRVERELWEDQNKLRSDITSMGVMAAEALQNKDWDALASLQRISLMKGLPFESVLKSANTHNQKREKDVIDTQFSPLKLQPYKDLGLIE